ncbi:MAG: DUF302 domain-containing protein [candidate division Zixibacteria bacterium]|nr:DUF302 domain-containing protein [candidate division Zixibacteria bacterium]
MENKLVYTLTTDKPFDTVIDTIEKLVPEHQFRVLAKHDVRATLAEKGLERESLNIIEVCNASFAHKALQKDELVSLFMPCRITVYVRDGRTVVNLARPSIIAEMMPGAGLEKLAGEVEIVLKKIVDNAVK